MRYCCLNGSDPEEIHETYDWFRVADIPAKEILKIMTVNGYRVMDTYETRGPLKTGLPADLIAVRANPLEHIDTLRDVRYVMKDGIFFKKDGVMTPEKFFHSGPTPPATWRAH